MLLCQVHAARSGGCSQVWGASGFRVCSWTGAMLPGVRVILGLAAAAGLTAASVPVDTNPVPAAAPF